MSQQSTAPSTQQQPSQADILAALSSQSSFRKRQPLQTAPFASFAGPLTELVTGGGGSQTADAADERHAGPSRYNARKVYCFRESCGSLILMDGVGEVVETAEAVVSYHELYTLTSVTLSL